MLKAQPCTMIWSCAPKIPKMNLHASFIDWKKGSHLEGTLKAKFIYTPGRIYTMVLFPQATLSDSWQDYFAGLL